MGPYDTEYTPHAISSNWLVNDAYRMGTTGMGIPPSPGYIMGQSPSDTLYVANYGSYRNQQAHKKLMGHLKMTEYLRGMGGDAEDFADDASDYGGMANVYLSQLTPVQQAMGGNIDLFSRRMVGQATSIRGIGGPYSMQGKTIWQKQKNFHDQSIANATVLGQDIMNKAYIDGDPFNVNKKFTRGFQIEEIADVVSQLAYTGDVNFKGDPDEFRVRNMKAVGHRLSKLSASRGVFGDQDVNTLQQRTESLLGSRLGTDDEVSTRILQGIAAEARLLNKDVENMVKSREVIKNTLISLNKARDSRGINLTYDGSGSVSGELEMAAMAIGSTIDHATKGMPKHLAAGHAKNMTQFMVTQRESPAGRMATLMKMGYLSGEVDERSYEQFRRAIRAGDTPGASKIATATLPNLEHVMANDTLYANAYSIMYKKGIERHGGMDAYTKALAKETLLAEPDKGRGGALQLARNVRLREAASMRDDVRTIGDRFDIDMEDVYSEEEQLRDYKLDLEEGVRQRARYDRAQLKDAKNAGVLIGRDAEGNLVETKMTKELYNKKMAEIAKQERLDLQTVRNMRGDSIEEIEERIQSSEAGIEGGRGDLIAAVANANNARRQKNKMMDAVEASGNVKAYVQLGRLHKRGAIDTERMEEIRDMDPTERGKVISALIDDEFDDEGQKIQFNREVDLDVDRVKKKYMRRPDLKNVPNLFDFDKNVSSMIQAEITNAKEFEAAEMVLGGQGAQANLAKQKKKTIKEDVEAANTLALDKNTAEKFATAIQDLVEATGAGKLADESNWKNGALKVHIVNPDEVKPKEQSSLTKDGGG